MKRFLLFTMLSIHFLLLFLPVSAFAQETADGFLYQVGNDGNVTITGYSGTNTKVDIPSAIDSHPVTAIGNGAFTNSDIITIVTIPEGVINIGKGAFSDCRFLEDVTLPSTLQAIGEGAFKSAVSLKSIVIPEGISIIESETFSNCPEMHKAILPKSLKTIEDASFCNSGLITIDLPQGLERIGFSAFLCSNSLESLNIPSSIKDVKNSQFDSCQSLKSVILSAGLSDFCYEFSYCPNLEKVAIPKSVKSIDSKYMFDGSYKVNIWGFSGSSAEKLAKKLNLPFVAVDPVKSVILHCRGENVNSGKLEIDLNSDEKTLQLTAQTSPDSPWPGVTWKSSNAKVASIDNNGLVTGLKKGKVTITATAIDGSGTKSVCEVIVCNTAK